MAKDKDKDVRHDVTLGFQGGGGLALKLTDKDAEALRRRLEKGELARRRGRRRPGAREPLAGRLRADRRDEPRIGFGLG